MRLLLAVSLLLLPAIVFSAEPGAEECYLGGKRRGAVTVEYGGRVYSLASEECRQEFLTDPQRYAQLYDALAELDRAGELTAPRKSSLVPS